MTPAGRDSVAETVTVIEHPSFISLYEDELGQEGLPITAVDPDKLPRLTVSIFPDAENKDLDALGPDRAAAELRASSHERAGRDHLRQRPRPIHAARAA